MFSGNFELTQPKIIKAFKIAPLVGVVFFIYYMP